MVSTPSTLFAEFCQHRSETLLVHNRMHRGLHTGTPAPTQERLRALEEMQDWCAQRNINSSQWLHALFCVRKFTYPPRLRREDLCSDRIWKRLADDPHWGRCL